jgi:hypothetical protein
VLDLFRSLISDIDENHRLRGLLYLVILLVCCWMLLVLSENNEILIGEVKLLNVELAELVSIDDETTWNRRLEAEKASRENLLKTRLWEGESENQKLAAIQSSIRKLVTENGLTRPSVRIGTPGWYVEEKGLKKVKVRVGGGFEGNAALRLLSSIEEFEPLLAVDRLDILVDSKPARGNSLSIDVHAFYEI